MLFAVLPLVWASSASAQLHWDASVHAGAYERFVVSGLGTALPGPTAGMQGHIALFPFIRAGVYASWDMSPTNGRAPPREFFSFGAQGKVFSPWPSGDLRLFLTAGVGYAGVLAPGGYTVPLQPRNDPMVYMATVDGSGGGFAEIPVGIGVSYRLRTPYLVYAEVLSRFGMGFWGTLYGEKGGRNAREPTLGTQAIGMDGYDLFALGLVVGIGLDR
jgi:hypothetical protein